MVDCVWRPESWCERCYTEPLIVDILDKEDCRAAYDFHPPKFMMDSDEDSDGEDYVSWTEAKKEIGRFIDHNMFMWMFENKAFD